MSNTMFLLSFTYEDVDDSYDEVLGVFSTFDKAKNSLKIMLNEYSWDEKHIKKEEHDNIYAISYRTYTTSACITIQEIEIDTILEDLQL